MRNSAGKIQLASLDELFGTTQAPSEPFQEIPLSDLHPFKGHPFHVLDDEKMHELAESVAQHGVLVPGIVRPRPEGGYELVSGHRRKRACELAGLTATTTPWKLVQKGINGDECIVDIIDYCAANRKEAQVWRLLQDGLKISAGHFPALCACIRCEFTDCAKLMLEKGMDFDTFKQWAAEKKLDLSQNETYAQLEAHWAGMQALEEQQGGGMQMGV